ncbi:MAG: class I SAM-dependent methyltransferase [Myxococcales bacterium]|nr:class I SAM-dependent methyltransferase [Myxococcales bacterium]
MSVVAWAVAVVWGLVFIAAAQAQLRRLPSPTRVVPEFGLWLPDGGEPPSVEPPPAAIHKGPEAPGAGPHRWLVLSGGVQVRPDLPGRLAACGAEFVSVLPRPKGGLLGLTIERLRRDFAAPQNVVEPTHPAAYADGRCAWLRLRDLALPGPEADRVLRAARARKAHGLDVDLRDGRGPLAPLKGSRGRWLVVAPAMTLEKHRATLHDLVAGDGGLRGLLGLVPSLLATAPLLLLPFEAARGPALLALGLGTCARLLTAVRDGFGHPLALAGWLTEPLLALQAAGAPRRPHPPMPPVPTSGPTGLVAPRAVEGGAWLEAAAVPFLARRLGGSAPVMEQIYDNQPIGRSALGRMVDRAVHASPASRAVRHRLMATIELGQALAPERLLSVPCGGGRDAAAIAASVTVLADPDPAARRLAKANNPHAQVVHATVEECPAGPFDLILFIGLAEYLDDPEVVRLLVSLRGRLAPGGALLASTTADHPQRGRMGRWLGWDTRARTPDALAELMDAAGFVVESRRGDPLDIQWVLLGRPRPMAPSRPPAEVATG